MGIIEKLFTIIFIYVPQEIFDFMFIVFLLILWGIVDEVRPHIKKMFFYFVIVYVANIILYISQFQWIMIKPNYALLFISLVNCFVISLIYGFNDIKKYLYLVLGYFIVFACRNVLHFAVEQLFDKYIISENVIPGTLEGFYYIFIGGLQRLIDVTVICVFINLKKLQRHLFPVGIVNKFKYFRMVQGFALGSCFFNYFVFVWFVLMRVSPYKDSTIHMGLFSSFINVVLLTMLALYIIQVYRDRIQTIKYNEYINEEIHNIVSIINLNIEDSEIKRLQPLIDDLKTICERIEDNNN